MASARARNSDPITSHEAAARVQGLTVTQYFICQLFDIYGAMSDEELCDRYRARFNIVHPASLPSIRSRRAELVTAGTITDTGKVKLTEYGRNTIVWDLAGRLF